MNIKLYPILLFSVLLTGCSNGDGSLFNQDTLGQTPNFLDIETDTNIAQKSVDQKEVIIEESLTITQKLLKSSVTILVDNENGKNIELGSGVFITPNLIATNYHVIENGIVIKVINNFNGIERNGIVYATDQIRDVAILKIESDYSSHYLTINSTLPDIGTHIWVAGTPEGLDGTLSEGIISSVRKDDDYDLLQISAPISPGSSGGPIINDKGELIGISVATFNTKRSQNLNFGVPAKYIETLITK